MEEQRAQALQQREDTRARIGAVLTPEQQARLDEQRTLGWNGISIGSPTDWI
jgi:Spy/CpxP family protein refolding chaperone